MTSTAKPTPNWATLLADFEQSASVIKTGGGAKANKRQHSKGRLTARERIAKLVDEDSGFHELMLYAGWNMYTEHGGCPSGGTVTGIGQIAGRDWLIVANDATVKAGAFFPITSKKVIRAQTIALENRLPIIYLVDSAGVYLPMQDEIFPDQDDFGRVFYLNARMSALGIPQIAAIMGNCVAGGAYLPVMSDTLIMTEGSGLYLAGPALVKAAIGQVIDSETLGGARVHASMSGTVDYLEPDDTHALERVRKVASVYTPQPQAAWAQNRTAALPPKHDVKEILELISSDNSKPYDVRDVVARLVDDSAFDEYKTTYGETLVTGFAHLGGFPIGIVANQRIVIKKKGRIEVGGVIYGPAADKAARFILNANQVGVPLLFLSDVTGFMVGRDSEHEGIIRRGAKMVNAVSNSVVPKLTLITGGSYGAGHYAMAGKAYGPRFIYAWPNAKYSVMSGNAAAKTLLDIQVAQLERGGHKIANEELKELYDEVKAKYDEALDPRYAAARLWLDDILHPLETRDRLIKSLEVCANNPHQEELKIGVFQV
ncbi:MAG: acyl-CoA carboxylase subunit beta [Trueperaceae bacterium]